MGPGPPAVNSPTVPFPIPHLATEIVGSRSALGGIWVDEEGAQSIGRFPFPTRSELDLFLVLNYLKKITARKSNLPTCNCFGPDITSTSGGGCATQGVPPYCQNPGSDTAFMSSPL